MSTTTRPVLTKAQAAMLRWIGAYYAANLRPPTFREMQVAFGIKSPNGVTCHVLALRRKGYLEPATDHKISRGLYPAGLPRAAIGQLIRDHVARLVDGEEG